MPPAQTRRAIHNVFGLPPAPAIRSAPRPKPALRRVARPGWPDLDDLLARPTVPALRRADSPPAAMTFADFRRLEQSCYATAGHLDEELFWWLTERMLGCLSAGRR
jgi:hypothetical protein